MAGRTQFPDELSLAQHGNRLFVRRSKIDSYDQCCSSLGHSFGGLMDMTMIKTQFQVMSGTDDGQNNNLQNPQWGSADTPRIRRLPSTAAFYNNDSHVPRNETNANLPSARRIMEEIFRKAKPHEDKTASHVLLEFGHFIVQDILGSKENSSDPFPIPCDGELTDYVFCPVTGRSSPINRKNRALSKTFTMDFEETGTTKTEEEIVIPFHRQTHIQIGSAPRATMNQMTSFLDLSNIYGVNETNTALLIKGGKLPLMGDGLAPDDDTMLTDGAKYGMNSSTGAYAMYIVFMRFHNLMAEEYSASGELDDDEIFELARRKTIAVYQSIVEEKYLPTLLGDKLDTYQGYNPDTDPSIDEFFAAVSFRYAHSSFSGLVRMVDENFRPTPSDPLLIRDTFRHGISRVIRENGGVEPFLRGLAVTPAKAVDASFVDDMNLWAEATSVMDVQRGREVGIPPYNEVREAFGLPRVGSFEELVGISGDDSHNTTHNDTVLVAALKRLNDNNVDLLDAYVGAVSEARETSVDNMGPLFTRSIKDQFTRLRDGDRFWYKATFAQEEYESFPDLPKMLKMVCEGMDLFPRDALLLPDSSVGPYGDDGACDSSGVATNQLSFLGGDLTVKWQVDEVDKTETTIDVTLSILKPMEGPGYIGIGWNSREMNGADIWFCTVRADLFRAGDPLPSTCAKPNSGEPMFSCCLAPGTTHNAPECVSRADSDLYYSLDVVEWCLTGDVSSVTVRALVWSDNEDNTASSGKNCFKMESTSDGRMDVIAAYNPISQNRPHGYQRRTNAQVNLKAGILTQSEGHTADSGLIATHGIFMMIGWLLVAPWAVFIVRYMKTRKWHLIAHISMMGFVGSMMIPLLIGVQASVGASDKTAQHSRVGLILMSVFIFIAAAGRFRYLKWEGQTLGKMTDFSTSVFHRYGGATFIGLAWWNCYTGLVRIGPEDSYAELVLFSTYSMGYNMDIFGAIRKYVYGPYIAFVGTVFLIAEIRKRRSTTARMTMEHAGSLWDDDGTDLDSMNMETFLDVTRLGNALCVVDGRVLDLTNFIQNHPGGPDLFRYVRGSDITEEFLGRRDVDGISHAHSQGALSLMKRFVKAKLVQVVDREGVEREGRRNRRGSSTLLEGSTKQRRDGFYRLKSVFRSLRHPGVSVPQAFRHGKVVDVQYLSPRSADKSNPIVLLRVSLPRHADDTFKVKDVTKVPGCSFRFRGIDKAGNMFERDYTAVLLNGSVPDNSRRRSLVNLDLLAGSTRSLSGDFKVAEDKHGRPNEGEFIVDFVISLIPGGSMSQFFLEFKTDKILLAQGPKFNKGIVNKIESKSWKYVVLLAAGTGIASMLQVIDYYLSRNTSEQCPRLFLVWILKSPASSYHDALGLEKRVERSRGQLKWVTIYSSSTVSISPEAVPKEGSFVNSLRPSMFSGPGSNKLRNIFWKKKKPRVKDLIAYAQLDEAAVCDEGHYGMPCGDDILLDGDFWGMSSQFLSRHVDETTIEALLKSIAKESFESSFDQGSFSDTSRDAGIASSEGSDENEAIGAALMDTVTIANRNDPTGLTTHLESFEGKEAVDCLLSLGYASSRNSAVKLGQTLMAAGIFRHVSLDEQFADDNSLYQFAISVRTGDKAIRSSVSCEDDENVERSGKQAPLSTLPKQECGLEQSRHDMPGISQSWENDDIANQFGRTNTSFRDMLTMSKSRDDGDDMQVERGTSAHLNDMPSMSPSLVDPGEVNVQVERRRNASFADLSVELQSPDHDDIDIQSDGVNACFDDMLVAVSGPPMFEQSLLEILGSLGLPREQIVTFVASSR